jgi:hypothetical protein
MKRTLNYTLTKLSGDDCCPSTITGTIGHDQTDEGTDECVWKAQIDIGCSAYGMQLMWSKPNTIKYGDGYDWVMQDTGFPGWSYGIGSRAADYATCSPLYWRWDSFTLTYPDAETCEYMLEIYE